MLITMKELRRFTVPPGSLAVWWLGQAGFILKSPGGRLVAIDPYLSDSCTEGSRAIGVDHSRSYPPPMSPGELVGIDMYVLTHSHQDHLDPVTLRDYRNAGGTGPYLAPVETVEKMGALGVSLSDISTTWPNKTHSVGDISLRATFAIPYSGDDLNHVGYLIATDDGPTFYLTGDTSFHEVIGISVAEHKPDVMLTVINGMWRNLSPSEAAALARIIQPRVVIPYHNDLFPDGKMSPHTLRLNLMLHQMGDRYMALQPGVPWVFAK